MKPKLGDFTGKHAARLLFGKWQEALVDVGTVDAIITDPPYGERTHRGDIAAAVQQQSATGQPVRRALSYECFTPKMVLDFVEAWRERNRGWWVIMCSHDLIATWEAALQGAGLYVFAPLPYIRKVPRLLGDGPASWADYIMVARPKKVEYSRWGCLPGAYVLPAGFNEQNKIAVGGKPLWLGRCLVRDYTRPGDLIADPFAGGGTFLVAARAENRKAIGAEADEETFALAHKRLGQPYTPMLFGGM